MHWDNLTLSERETIIEETALSILRRSPFEQTIYGALQNQPKFTELSKDERLDLFEEVLQIEIFRKAVFSYVLDSARYMLDYYPEIIDMLRTKPQGRRTH